MLQTPKIKVRKEDIIFPQKVLLDDGNTFDDERLRFIKNFDTIDLQAEIGRAHV